MTNLPQLPVLAVLHELRAALAGPQRAVLTAPPGSGKTTCVPLALLDEPWLDTRSIVILEPRRLATRAAARRMASILHEEVGETVGYRIRFENVTSPRTRIEVVTEGILTRRLQSAPELSGVGCIIFDEFHERSIHADLALALCLDAAAGLREDLRILVMSATLEAGPIARLINGPVIEGHGKMFPVDIHYLAREAQGYNESRGTDIARLAALGVRTALRETTGDVLTFLPGTFEIRNTHELLAEVADQEGVIIHPLFGDLPAIAQDLAILPDAAGRRKVVLATAIAETSLTIEGVTTVVDSGWSRVPRFIPDSGLSRLVTVRASKAAVDQRAGRAGRTAPGVCFRLWPEYLQPTLLNQFPPEITSVDLAPLVLDLALWGVLDPGMLAWIDTPPSGAYAQARNLLILLGALNQDGTITAIGRRMAALPVHPRLAHLLIEGERWIAEELACDLAALIADRDILRRGNELPPVDIEIRTGILKEFRKIGPGGLTGRADTLVCMRIAKAAAELQRILGTKRKYTERTVSPGRLLAAAFPDRVGKLREGSRGRFLLSSGTGAIIPQSDNLAGEEYIVVPNLDAGFAEGRVFLAAALREDELRTDFREQIIREEVVTWDEASGVVSARLEERLGAVRIASKPMASPSPERVRSALLQAVRESQLALLPWNAEARNMQSRLLSLRVWRPQDGWPDVSDAALQQEPDTWLGPWLDGMRRREDLKKLDMVAILKNFLDYRLQRRLDEGAPTHITVPSGSRRPLSYQPGGQPVLAVRLQEMFGLADTPRVCWDEVPVLIHLLSPAQRPVQVTADLRGFWNGAYQEVKKELRGRYPRHHWPDDPWTAQATARAKPRK